MCGRYATTRGAADLGALFESSDETGGGLSADWNLAPTRAAPIVRLGEPAHRVTSLARWGFLPPWARDASGAARMINARAETVATTRAYARAFARHRCLVPADGWYEWVRSSDGRRQPYFMTRSDGGVLAMAGIWSVWGDADQRTLTFSVITTGAVGGLAEVHHRMPLLLPPTRWSDWLAGGGEPAELLAPPGAGMLEAIEIRPVGPEVGNVRNNGPALVERVPTPPAGTRDPAELTLF